MKDKYHCFLCFVYSFSFPYHYFSHWSSPSIFRKGTIVIINFSFIQINVTRLYFSFKSVTDRTVINILIILLSTKNCIELTLNYAEFYFPAETSIIPEVQYSTLNSKYCHLLILELHQNLLSFISHEHFKYSFIVIFSNIYCSIWKIFITTQVNKAFSRIVLTTDILQKLKNSGIMSCDQATYKTFKIHLN